MSYFVGMPCPPFDPTRAAALYRLFAAAVLRRLRAKFRATDTELLADAVVDAVLDFAATSVEVSEGAVYFAARYKALTLTRTDYRRKSRDKKAGIFVTESALAATSVLEEIAAREQLREREGRLARTSLAGTPVERQVLDLMLVGKTDPTEMAAATGLSEAEAVRVYARLRKRLSRERKLAATEAL